MRWGIPSIPVVLMMLLSWVLLIEGEGPIFLRLACRNWLRGLIKIKRVIANGLYIVLMIKRIIARGFILTLTPSCIPTIQLLLPFLLLEPMPIFPFINLLLSRLFWPLTLIFVMSLIFNPFHLLLSPFDFNCIFIKLNGIKWSKIL